MKPIQLEIKTYEELKEELGNEYDTAMYEINISALKEIERLNNIINELEKDIEEYVSRTKENMKYVDTLYIRAVYNDLANILNKLQELKGDGSND